MSTDTLVENAVEKNFVEFEENFDRVVREKIMSAITEKKDEDSDDEEDNEDDEDDEDED